MEPLVKIKLNVARVQLFLFGNNSIVKGTISATTVHPQTTDLSSQLRPKFWYFRHASSFYRLHLFKKFQTFTKKLPHEKKINVVVCSCSGFHSFGKIQAPVV